MNNRKLWPVIISVTVSFFSVFMGLKKVIAFSNADVTNLSQFSDDSKIPEDMSCESPSIYTRVRPQQGAPVYSRPNGSVIGLIPHDWAVIQVRRDGTGRWSRITGHHGDGTGTHSRFRSAPAFRSGWVISSSLEFLGLSCEKPVSSSLLNYLLATHEDRSFHLQTESWLQMGDRIANFSQDTGA